MRLLIGIAVAWLVAGAASAQDSAELAKKLSNPISSMISVPFQNNWDCCFGPKGDQGRYVLNFQPVIPIALSPDLTLITRTIVPIQDVPQSKGGSQWGLGDTTQSFFFSPKPGPGGLIWGVGPALLYPTGTSGLSAAKWGAGPTIVILKQQGPITFGVLANQIWSFAGASSRPEISSLFLQPFYAYGFKDSTTLGLNSESTYDWIRRQWVVPVNFTISHVYKLGGQPWQLGATARVYAVSPEHQPSFGLRFTATLVIPK